MNKYRILPFVAGLLVFGVLLVEGSNPDSSNRSFPSFALEASAHTNSTAVFRSFDEALRAAGSEHRLMMVDVYTDWCGWCKRLDRDVYTNNAVVQELTANFEAAKLNAESLTTHLFKGTIQTETEMANAWGVSGYPTILFISGDGTVVKVVVGYMSASDFLALLRYMKSGAYRKEEFQAWRSTNG